MVERAEEAFAIEIARVVEERMQIGKHEVESGGVVVRSRIVEASVQQDVVVRAEHTRLMSRIGATCAIGISHLRTIVPTSIGQSPPRAR